MKETLQRRLAEMLAEWELTPTADLISGPASLVLPVVDPNRRRCALKIKLSYAETRGEAATLQLWRCQGAAELLRADPRRGVLLLERLDRALTEETSEEAYPEIARLYAALHRPASPKLESWYATVTRGLDRLAGLGREVPAPPRFVEQALRAGRQLVTGRPTHVIHGDLHDGNVMWRARTKEWVAIAPKGFNGDPCYEPAAAMWNRWDELEWYGNPGESLRDRFFVLVDGGELDERRTRDWVVVRSMLNVSRTVLDARGEQRGVTEAERAWITRNVTLCKAMQEIRPAGRE